MLCDVLHVENDLEELMVIREKKKQNVLTFCLKIICIQWFYVKNITLFEFYRKKNSLKCLKGFSEAFSITQK